MHRGLPTSPPRSRRAPRPFQVNEPVPVPADDNPGHHATTVSRGRIAELQNPLDRAIYHPLAGSLAGFLARTPITPNMVSLVGGVAIVLAGIAYVQPGWPLPALMGLGLHMSWHVFDGADGDLARRTGRVSTSGEIIDGICDYAGHVVLYVLLANWAAAGAGPMAWITAVAAGLSRVLQANFHEVQRRRYANWAYGVDWLGSGHAESGRGVLGLAARGYLRIANSLARPQPGIDAAASDPAQRVALSRLVRHSGPAAFAGSGLLGANYRTLALGLSMLAGSPMWYFAYEAVLLNIVLASGVVRSRSNLAALRRKLQPASKTSL